MEEMLSSENGSSVTENGVKTPISEEANKTPHPGNAEKEDQNPNPTNPSSPSSPSLIFNSVYDPAFELIGVPIDPHLRLLKAQTGK